MNRWKPGLAEVSYKLGYVRTFVRLSVRPFVHKIAEVAHQVFLFFCMKLKSHKVKKRWKFILEILHKKRSFPFF